MTEQYAVFKILDFHKNRYTVVGKIVGSFPIGSYRLRTEYHIDYNGKRYICMDKEIEILTPEEAALWKLQN